MIEFKTNDGGCGAENSGEGVVVRPEVIPEHVAEDGEGQQAVTGAGIAGDHGIVEDSIPGRKRDAIEEAASEGEAAGGGVGVDEGGGCSGIGRGGGVEEVAGGGEVAGLGVEVHKAVEDVGARLETGGDDVGVEGAEAEEEGGEDGDGGGGFGEGRGEELEVGGEAAGEFVDIEGLEGEERSRGRRWGHSLPSARANGLRGLELGGRKKLTVAND